MNWLPVDHSRRALLRARLTPTESPHRPPWAADGFEDLCTRCGSCLTACPEDILVVGDGGFPAVDFSRGGECTFCGACAAACAEPAFDVRRQPPWNQVARIDTSCLARNGVHCQSCAEVCAWGAIRFGLALGAPPQPLLDTDACTGCGACVGVCPEQAVAVVHRESRHG